MLNRRVVGDTHQFQYKYTVPLSTKQPILFQDHFEIDIDDYLATYPLGKIIVIRQTIDDRLLINANLFFKIYGESLNNVDTKQQWSEISCTYFNGAESIGMISNDLLKGYFDEKITYDIPKLFNILTPKDDRLLYIDYKDIFEDKNKILSILCELTKKPVTEYVIKKYDDYLAKQDKIKSIIDEIYQI